MEMIKVKLPDGSEKEHEKGITVLDATKDISEGLARVAMGALVNGEIKGMQEKINQDADFKVLKFEDKEGKQIFWHTSAHIMANAVMRLFPGVKFAIGPAIDNGFYYDFDTEHRFTPEDLEKIEAEMAKIVKEGLEMERYEMPRDEALKYFKEHNEPYKVDLIENLPEDEIISFYKQGEFIDLCAGPHLRDTSKVKAVKLLSIAGAYWRGDEKNKMLQRIYGICFDSEEDIKKHLDFLEEAKKRDHRKLGRELELFMFSEYGPGFPFWLPHGMTLRRELEEFWYQEHIKEGYQFIKTPIMLNKELWELSGHWNNYKENMYTSMIDENPYAIKPMNCPGGILIYKNGLHSYKELPIRAGELGLVHRHEASGALNGLFRVRTFTQDDAHIFMREEQIEDEIIRLINFIDRMYKVFGLEYKIELSTRPLEKYIGSIEIWDKAEKALESACKKAEKEYKVNPGDGAFYGPKLDFHVKDSIGRVWQCGTIQLDLNLPERFDLTYVEDDGSKKRPIMLHRVIYGSIERFIGILIEHYAGAFPLWMAPIQVNILPVNNEFHLEYAKEIKESMFNVGIRVELDSREEKVGYKIRESQIKKIPYTIILGDKELSSSTISYREYGSDETNTVSKEEFITLIKEQIKNKN